MCPLKWYYCVADQAGPPLAIYRRVSDLHICMVSKIHYQHLEILMILYRMLTSFHQNYPPYVETRAAKRRSTRFPYFFEPGFQHVKAILSQILPYLKCNWSKFAGKSVKNLVPLNVKAMLLIRFFSGISLCVPTLRTSHQVVRGM